MERYLVSSAFQSLAHFGTAPRGRFYRVVPSFGVVPTVVAVVSVVVVVVFRPTLFTRFSFVFCVCVCVWVRPSFVYRVSRQQPRPLAPPPPPPPRLNLRFVFTELFDSFMARATLRWPIYWLSGVCDRLLFLFRFSLRKEITPPSP